MWLREEDQSDNGKFYFWLKNFNCFKSTIIQVHTLYMYKELQETKGDSEADPAFKGSMFLEQFIKEK